MSSTQSTPGNASAIDMSQFFQVFFDEAAEHLADMETQLLAVDPAEPDAESLNAIFRAAHSIKGGSGTFGFTDMAELTHEAETLLDRLWKRELQITVPMIDTLLEAGDVLRAQLARHRGESKEQVDAAPIVRRLNALASETNEPQAAARSLSLQFTLIAQANFDMLLADLSRLGEITTLQGPDAGRGCTVGLLTDADDAEISVRLRTAAEPASIQVSVSGQESAPVADPGYGFFSDDPAPVRAEPADPGYGFFTDAPAAPGASAPHAAATEPAASWGRRSTDDPNVVTAPAGRRGSDKQVVSPNGDSSSIRVGVDKVDQLINLVGELVITQAMLSQKAARLAAGENVDLSTGMADLERNTRDLQESVMSIRMLPMSFVFNRFPRMLRDLAAKLGKQVELKTIGEQTELDKGVIEKIADPMNHLVRNSVDHGIELPEERASPPASRHTVR